MSNARTKVCSGYQAVIEASIQAGCQAYFAAPSPFHAFLLNEGARRFSETNGWFIQAESPADAMAMALGSAATGHQVLVSGNDQDFLAMQEVLAYFVAQKCPAVLAILNDGGPAMALPRPAGHQMRYYLEPRILGGFALTSLVPTTPQHVYELTLKAFQLSVEWLQPVLLILEPPVFHAAATLHLHRPGRRRPHPPNWGLAAHSRLGRIDEPAALAQLAETYHQIQLTCGQAHVISASEPTGAIRVAIGSLGAWLSHQLPPQDSLLIPETLYPFPIQQLEQLRQTHPEDAPVILWEYDYPWMAQWLQARYPHWQLQSRVVSFENLMWPRNAS